jgi:hypothetical protein
VICVVRLLGPAGSLLAASLAQGVRLGMVLAGAEGRFAGVAHSKTDVSPTRQRTISG